MNLIALLKKSPLVDPLRRIKHRLFPSKQRPVDFPMTWRGPSEKVALVTGASRGNGRAIARRLAADGALVAVHYTKSVDLAQSLVDEIKAHGGDAFAVQADFEDLETLPGLFAQIDEALALRGKKPQIDILINNAGIYPNCPLESLALEEFDRIFSVNVRALLRVAQLSWPRMSEGGRIINISSILVRMPVWGLGAYSASKAALEALTRQMALELGLRGITVNAVSLGVIDNGGTYHGDQPQWLQGVIAEQALKRIGQVEDVANAVAALVGPDCGWITGQIIEVSGGWKL